MSEKLSDELTQVINRISSQNIRSISVAVLEDWRDKFVELENKLDNPTCHQGHSDYPLTLWDCPTCVQIEKTALRECILAMENDQACLPEDVSVTEHVSALRQKLTRLLGQVSDIPGVNLEAKISVLRLWAEPEMDRRRTLESGGDDETKNEIPPKVGREDVEHPHPQT